MNVLMTRIMMIIAAAAFVAMAFLNIASYRYSSTAQFIEVKAEPNQVLCPGDTGHYAYLLTPKRVPVVARVLTSVWSLETDRSIHATEIVPSDSRIWLEMDPIENMEEFIVPILPTGAYQLRVGVESEGAKASAFKVAFSVPEGCSEGT